MVSPGLHTTLARRIADPDDPFPDSMFVPSGIPRRGAGRIRYLLIELVVAALFVGVYAMVLTRGRIIGW